MTQGRLAMRGWLVALAAATVLGFGAFLAMRALSASQEVVAPAATPEPIAPAVASSRPAVTPSAAAIAAEEAAREASWREGREATIRVQQRLRAEQQARKAAQLQLAKDERCVEGQRMKRVDNGWVQAGSCNTSR
jgi:hypothetical protein